MMCLVVNYVRLRHRNRRLQDKVTALLANQSLQESTTRLLATENGQLRKKIGRLEKRCRNRRGMFIAQGATARENSLATSPVPSTHQ
ncbi:hypothetical protein [Saccharibacter floricola]|uniref:hypothetical protein n=1 Tax=Saccharibacter floricola TaxID=231053 RepID=UPI00036369CB|nr:hypothetical protein [Saccharibacter floricola]